MRCKYLQVALCCHWVQVRIYCMSSETTTKEKRLHIRASASQKALLERAAKRRHVNVSQFVLQTCLEAAEKAVREEEAPGVIRVSAAEYDWLMQKLAEPPQEISELRHLLEESAVWNG